MCVYELRHPAFNRAYDASHGRHPASSMCEYELQHPAFNRAYNASHGRHPASSMCEYELQHSAFNRDQRTRAMKGIQRPACASNNSSTQQPQATFSMREYAIKRPAVAWQIMQNGIRA
ncbi:hypothetical protein BDZ97DRAFT_1752362 [Flammula alnicola]|nr:hypothetical protein BDZ97DRAFT_1752362 [Flammula alnicola]